ncbi:hypothetical protein [Emticicia sp. BO119]|uniref:hypothetical protein n=1 Tax=Emticicia sp. BO119 TaxID=2757768 RepID=UPI0015F12325|nr:hypothetical protein [Emticicia sp. BO119]MBA4849116.1 hypothetical protein [Emticicia sp. BO119]
MKSNRSYFLKFFEIFFLLLVLIGLTQYFDFFTGLQMQVVTNATLIWIVCGVLFALSAGLSFVWHRFIKKVDLHQWFQPIITYYVAHQITTYGAAKLLKTQFQAPNFILEMPVGELNGFWLTWTYFGYSQTFAFILGAMQVAGSILLIFRKTRLLATFILLPILVNIDFIDHFYEISPLAYYNSLHYTFILIFLMFLDVDKLVYAFLSYKEYFYFNKKTVLLNLLRVIIIGGAFLHIYLLKLSIQPKTPINGIWKIDEITMHNQKVVPSVATMDSVWSKIYFEWRYGLLIKYNPYEFNKKKDLFGQYEVDEPKHLVKIALQNADNKVDSLKLNYQVNDSTMIMLGMYQKDSLVMKLTKLK